LVGSEPSVDRPKEVATIKQEPHVQAQAQEQPSRSKSHQSRTGEATETSSVTTQEKTYPESLEFLIGEWECLTPGNNYQMRVSWDGKSGQFLGYLTKQGQASQGVGFRIGERVWIAEPIDDQTFVERQKLRNGFGASWWNNQKVDVRESSNEHLSAYAEFKRVQ